MQSTTNPESHKVIFVLGPPGSGKDTLCKSAGSLDQMPGSSHLYCHVSVQNLVREIELEASHENAMARDYARGDTYWDSVLPQLRQKIESTFNECGAETIFLIDTPPGNESLLGLELLVGKPMKHIILKCERETAETRFLTRAKYPHHTKEYFEKVYNGYFDDLVTSRDHYRNMVSVPVDGDREQCLEAFLNALRTSD
ncbi:P-loop containing nucleoside triphosphate hydrolase protein [Nemania sp. FL0916]|nr:P-loop containing nucleoside triphosphate hydrolase protein [Nemania sp. FL0916]